MIVLDASAVIEWLLQTKMGGVVERRMSSDVGAFHVPHLLDLEVAQVLRRYVSAGLITGLRASAALEDLAALGLIRYAHDVLLGRVWQLRDVLSVYDAAYVALAEALNVPLVTCDPRITRARGHSARIELIKL